jgi:hypothetical protein
MINDIDGLWVNCDAFDDGIVNASCASGVGPVPTPTRRRRCLAQGRPSRCIARSQRLVHLRCYTRAGWCRFLCNTNFPGTTHCEYSELLTAESGGELAGAVDTGANVVTSFWVIDAGALNITQCTDTVGTTDWNYATAHNGNHGDFVNLNNGTGDLGPIRGTLGSCTASKWVGCCL